MINLIKDQNRSKLKVDLSVIIPSLNSEIVNKTIESIIDQAKNYSYEIVIVGQDRFNLINSFLSPNVKFFETNDPVPPGVARNIGVSNSTGKFLLFIDADCVALPNWIDEHLEVHKSFRELIVTGGSITFNQDHYLNLVDNISTFHEYMDHLPFSKKSQLPSINLCLHRSIWDNYGGFNANPAGEDSEFTTKLALGKVPLLFTPNAKVEHRHNRNSFKSLVNHAYQFGRFSIKGNKKYQNELKVPYILRNEFLSQFLSPVLSFGLLLKIVLLEKLPFRYWKTLPVVFLLKTIWCFGLASRHKGEY